MPKDLQRLGHDYNETHSLVVHLETIRAILALVQAKRYMLQQMDVKGAYLNGTLREEIYMRQPEDFSNGTKHMCQLLKTLYGLKQSGREWNIELNYKMHKHGFTCLRADPCIYIWQQKSEVGIVTV